MEKLLQSTNVKEHLNDVNEDGESVLALACSNGYTDLVRLLLTTLPDVDVDDRGTKQDCTPLMEGLKNKARKDRMFIRVFVFLFSMQCWSL